MPKTSANNPTVIKSYRLNRRQGVLRGFFNGRSIKCSLSAEGRKLKAGGSQARPSFLSSAYRPLLTALCFLLSAYSHRSATIGSACVGEPRLQPADQWSDIYSFLLQLDPM